MQMSDAPDQELPYFEIRGGEVECVLRCCETPFQGAFSEYDPGALRCLGEFPFMRQKRSDFCLDIEILHLLFPDRRGQAT
jgi:hypothetical protein